VSGHQAAPETGVHGPSKIRTSAKTRGYYRTSSPVTALPMIMRWISDVPSKIVKLVEVRAVSAGRWPDSEEHVSTNSAPVHALIWRLNGSVAGAGPVEVGQHVDCTLGQGPSEPAGWITVSRATPSQPQRTGDS